jgi:hypothetical protein
MRGGINANSGDPEYNEAVGEYKAAIKGAAGELERILTGAHGAEASKEYWLKALDPSQSTLGEVKGAWKQAYNLMYGRMTELAKQKSAAFGKEIDPISLLDEKQQKLAKKLGGHPYQDGEEAPLDTKTYLPGDRAPSVIKWERGPDGRPRPAAQ